MRGVTWEAASTTSSDSASPAIHGGYTALALTANILGSALEAARKRAEDARATESRSAQGRSGAQDRALRSAELREERMQQELKDLVDGYADQVVTARSNRDPSSYSWVSRRKFDSTARKLASRLMTSRSRSIAENARAMAKAEAATSRGDRRTALAVTRGRTVDESHHDGSHMAGHGSQSSYAVGGVDAMLARALAPPEPVGWLVVPAPATSPQHDELAALPPTVRAEACVP